MILDAVGAPDGVVHNAGVAGVGCVEEMPLKVMEEMLATNFMGPIRLTRELLPAMRTAGHGRIVVVSSESGLRGMPGISSYGASKGALERWSESLAGEIAPFGLGVTVLVTGTFKTDILEQTHNWKDPEGPYARLHEQLESKQDLVLRLAPSPDSFAPSVERALDEHKPFERHAVGLDAKAMLYGGKVIPGRFMAWVATRALGLPRPGSLRLTPTSRLVVTPQDEDNPTGSASREATAPHPDERSPHDERRTTDRPGAPRAPRKREAGNRHREHPTDAAPRHQDHDRRGAITSQRSADGLCPGHDAHDDGRRLLRHVGAHGHHRQPHPQPVHRQPDDRRRQRVRTRLPAPGAIYNGATVAELEAIIVHAAAYIGYPAAGRALNAIVDALLSHELLNEPSPPSNPERRELKGSEKRARGLEMLSHMQPDSPLLHSQDEDAPEVFAAELDLMLLENVYYDLWTNTDALDPRTRSVVTLGLIMGIGNPDALSEHVPMAVHNGICMPATRGIRLPRSNLRRTHLRHVDPEGHR